MAQNISDVTGVFDSYALKMKTDNNSWNDVLQGNTGPRCGEYTGYDG